MAIRIAAIGEAMVEVALARDDARQAQIGFAGDTLNTAIYLARTGGPALAIDYVTRLGTDAFSAQMRGFIAAEGIGTDSIDTDPQRIPGLYAISTDATGERSFAYWRDNSAARQMFMDESGAADCAGLGGFDILYLSAITLAVMRAPARAALMAFLPGYRAAGGRVAFDSNYRPRLWPDVASARTAIAAMWRQTDIGLPSVDDEMAIFGDANADAVLARLRGWGLADGALKCGAAGPVALDPAVAQAGAGLRYPPAEAVIDTTAAGDSFNAGYLAARLTGADAPAALMAGHMLARRVVGVRGAIIPRADFPAAG